MGRFTQEDPIGLAGGLNAYGFANGDPVSYRDPYGLSAEDCCERLGLEGDRKNVERSVQYAQNASASERIFAGSIFFAVIAPEVTPAIGSAVLRGIGTGTLVRFGAIGAAGGRIAQAAGNGSPLARIQRAGQLVGRMRLGQDRAMRLLRSSIGRMDLVHGEETSLGGIKYLLSANSSRGGVVRALAVARDGSVTNAVLRETKTGFELVH